MELKKLYPLKADSSILEVQQMAYDSFTHFVRLVSPFLVFGDCHFEAAKFFTDTDHQVTGARKLLLFPRAHLKSKLLAHYVAWRIVRDPTITVVYASASSPLSVMQLYDIKSILDSKIVSKYFPQLLMGVAEGKREKWSEVAINVEHPLRRERRIRDYTVKATGASSNTTGFHCDILALDDITSPEVDSVNPWTKAGRDKVERWYSQSMSKLNPNGDVLAVGTRYHSEDIYAILKNIEVAGSLAFDTLAEVVEKDGEFLWPRRTGKDGKEYGFDAEALAMIKSQYLDKAQFFAQYYNDPTDPENRKFNPEHFQYYDKSAIAEIGGQWYAAGKALTIYAAIDFATTITKRSDYTVLTVGGLDVNGRRYVLDISRFKTDKISKMVEEVFRLYSKWGFRKIRAEKNAQQGIIIEQIRDMLQQRGVVISWDAHASRGDKNIRIMSILEPLYEQKLIFHYKGGNCEILEDELVATKPAHEDTADSWAMCNELISNNMMAVTRSRRKQSISNITYHPRFGGVA